MQITSVTRVDTFLDSISRNSTNTYKTYRSGLVHFNRFLNNIRSSYNTETIILLLQKQKVNVYELLNDFISFMHHKHPEVGPSSLKLYIAAIRSYLEFYNIDIVSSKFKHRVKMPRFHPDTEQPIDISDIRELLNQCNNARLRCYLLVLLSSGLRVVEAASLRLMDVDFTSRPTRIHVRKEYSKTKRPRDVYISDEATKYLQKLLEFRKNELTTETLIFSVKDRSALPIVIYDKMLVQFHKLQRIIHKDQRKENSQRRRVTLHSFRRAAFSIINDQAGSEYANWFLGHNHSVYWTKKESERRDIYLKKCMPALTVLDYSALDIRSKNIEVALKEKDKAIQQLTIQMKEMQEYQNEMRVLLQNPKKLMEMLQENNN